MDRFTFHTFRCAFLPRGVAFPRRCISLFLALSRASVFRFRCLVAFKFLSAALLPPVPRCAPCNPPWQSVIGSEAFGVRVDRLARYRRRVAVPVCVCVESDVLWYAHRTAFCPHVRSVCKCRPLHPEGRMRNSFPATCARQPQQERRLNASRRADVFKNNEICHNCKDYAKITVNIVV